MVSESRKIENLSVLERLSSSFWIFECFKNFLRCRKIFLPLYDLSSWNMLTHCIYIRESEIFNWFTSLISVDLYETFKLILKIHKKLIPKFPNPSFWKKLLTLFWHDSFSRCFLKRFIFSMKACWLLITCYYFTFSDILFLFRIEMKSCLPENRRKKKKKRQLKVQA